ncbi:uncharacterized protein LOC111948665 isoform X2 [Oryzias latipes]|uniref:uncharacterized protein LOC111948665 isoform X2 n=1 Tax=Oryzias latipes TaxID=8090 RepID=UPI000CE21875|nr:uncharacterized protein LOC111948665 isoform X2 [Oryzias latipes]
MTEASSLLTAVLTVVSVVSLSLLSLLCLRCKRKSLTIHEDSQVYNPQTFQRGGSKFAVVRSKTVNRAYQISPTTEEVPEEAAFPEAPEQSDYQNITDFPFKSSPDYVAPIGISVYENTTNDSDLNQDNYENIFTSEQVGEDEDYENSSFLNNVVEELDYVNENGE